jgi:hypothetical protein
MVLGASMLGGCFSVAAVPPEPHFATEEDRACGRSCQVVYNQCVQAFSEMRGWGVSSRLQRRSGFARCADNLRGCYGNCGSS